MNTRTISEDLRAAASRFPTGNENPRLEAEVLLAHVLGCDRSWLIAHAQDTLAACQCRQFQDLITRRIAGEPVAYLTGHREFWSLDLQVNREVLIPRPETELLVETVLDCLQKLEPATMSVADLGTGSGAIAVAIACEQPRVLITATDISRASLKLARDNARRHQLANLCFAASDWCTALAADHYQVICSNPPYIAEMDPHLKHGDVRFEPRVALCAGDDGLRDLSRIISEARRCLVPGGRLLVEHGADQGRGVRGLFAGNGYRQIQTLRDLAGHERVSLARHGG